MEIVANNRVQLIDILNERDLTLVDFASTYDIDFRYLIGIVVGRVDMSTEFESRLRDIFPEWR